MVPIWKTGQSFKIFGLTDTPTGSRTHYLGISVGRKTKRVLFPGLWVSAALHQDTAWHQGEEKLEEDGPQLPPPRTPFVSSGCSPWGTGRPTTSTASTTEQSALPILLRDPPACSHNLWTALFLKKKYKAEPPWCLSLQVIFITKLELVRPSEMKWKELKVTFCALSV